MKTQDAIQVDRRALRTEMRENGDDYLHLSPTELCAISYCTIAEMQRRDGDRSTTHWLAYLAEKLPDMAKEIRMERTPK